MISKELKDLVKQNIREYGMYIVLVIIMVIFTIATKGIFISSRNIANLLNQTGYIAVLAVGMTLVIVIRHIDLSVGFLAGFLGAVARNSVGFLEHAGFSRTGSGTAARRNSRTFNRISNCKKTWNPILCCIPCRLAYIQGALLLVTSKQEQ